MRYPVEPIITICTRRWRPNNEFIDQQATRIVKTADILGVTRGTVYRWIADGLNEKTADHAAATLNLHPAEIWPEWFHNP